MNIDIKHKHTGHLIVIEGHPFKANDAGQWDLTEIWQTLKLPKGKQPGKFMDRKEAQRLEQTGKIGSLNRGRSGSRTLAAKQAVIRYAAWVSSEFEDMVFDAFEAILEMPEVATVVIQKMAEMGREKSAELLARSAFNDKCDWKALKRGPQSQTPAAKAHRQRKAQEAKLAARIRRNVSREGI
ncbi:hypothetical protein [Stutzerimonas stutzeri]|uniref:hypothetical protein n=1 Tax=Stutzerimonas stutzeri TaxID=316 RepID=UPI00190A7065|nr:hypothetical protein [Stutzerimonas stutzeri]MBK3806841.1 hypothetical protein [Stutzerimonas stutzeri]MBK3851201.1 hypothetical protein [Stutzerimonas stutzeri]